MARVGLTCAYWIGGLNKIVDFSGAVAEQEHFGLRPGAAFAAATIFVELGGALLVISGRFVWLGAGALGVFTTLAACVANNFWALQGQARFMAMNAFFEHLGLVAGLVMAALLAEHDQRSRR